MAVTPVYSNVQPLLDTTQGTQLLRGTITFSGSYTAGGDPINWATTAVGAYKGMLSRQRPISVQWWEEPAIQATLPLGLVYTYRPNVVRPSATNGFLQIQAGGTIAGTVPTPGAELGAGAYNALILAMVLRFEIIVPLGI